MQSEELEKLEKTKRRGDLSIQLEKVKSKTVVFKFKDVEFTLTDYQTNHNLDEDEEYLDLNFWLSLPRGLAEVKVGEQLIHTLVGLRKYGDANDNFGYGFNKDWNHCFTTIKENGECYHFSAFFYNEQLYYLLGSKNVHIIIDPNGDVSAQLDCINEEQQKRASFATKMAEYFINQYAEKSEMMKFIADNGLCFIGESIDPENEHIVAYTERTIKFFAITKFSQDRKYLYSRYSPEVAFEIFKRFNLPTVDWVKCSSESELDFQKNLIQLQQNMEGLVIYYCDAEGNVEYIHKYKNEQYALLRTCRQLWRSNVSLLSFKKRLDNYHFAISDEDKKNWLKFYSWLVNKVDKNQKFSYDLYTQWSQSNYDFYSEQIVVIFVGIPGSGKTTIGSQVQANLVKNGIASVYTDQDLFHCDNKAYGQELQNLCSNDKIKVVIQGRCNINKFQREFSRSYVTGQKVLYVVINSDNQSVEVCIDRVKTRPFHPCLKADKADKVCKSFQSIFEPIEDSELDENSHVLTLDLQSSIESKVEKVLKQIQSMMSVKTAIDFWIYPNWTMCNFIAIKLDYRDIMKVVDIKMLDERTLNLDRAVQGAHVTLWHRCSMDFDFGIQASNWIGKTVEIKCQKICWNNDVAALFVSINDADVKSANKWPHITLKRRKGIPPVYSNYILEDDHETIEINSTITGIVTRN